MGRLLLVLGSVFPDCFFLFGSWWSCWMREAENWGLVVVKMVVELGLN